MNFFWAAVAVAVACSAVAACSRVHFEPEGSRKSPVLYYIIRIEGNSTRIECSGEGKRQRPRVSTVG